VQAGAALCTLILAIIAFWQIGVSKDAVAAARTSAVATQQSAKATKKSAAASTCLLNGVAGLRKAAEQGARGGSGIQGGGWGRKIELARGKLAR